MDNWISFYVELKWSENDIYDSFMGKLLKYNIGQYIVGKEVAEGTHNETEGEHIHVCCQMSDDDYHRFVVTVLRQQMKLRGRAGGGFCRQYGKVKQMRSLEKMKAYCVKDCNVDTNIGDDELEKLIKISYKKCDTLTTFWTCVNALYDEMDGGWDNHYVNPVDVVIKCLIATTSDHTKTPSRSYIDNVIKSYVMFRANITEDQRLDIIKKILYG